MNFDSFFCGGLGRGSKKRSSSESMSKTLRRSANRSMENEKSTSLPIDIDARSIESNTIMEQKWHESSWESVRDSEVSTKAIFSRGPKSLKDLDEAVDFNAEIERLAEEEPETCVKLLRQERVRLEIILEDYKIKKLQLQIKKMQREIKKLEEEEDEEVVRQAD